MLTAAQQQIKDSLGEQFESIKGLSKHRYIHSLLNGDKVNSTYYVNIAKKHGLELEHITSPDKMCSSKTTGATFPRLLFFRNFGHNLTS